MFSHFMPNGIFKKFSLIFKASANFFKKPIFALPLASLLAHQAWANESLRQPSGFEQLVPFLIIGLVFYFLLIRPQQKKYKQHSSFLSQIKRGDEVLTNSGIFGTIEGLTDQFVVLEVAENTKIRVLKSHISSFANNNSENKKEK